jgi:predicted Zn finger-like uncharacterized protein
MVKVNCEACGAPYEVDPRRIPEKGLRMRCPSCSSTFVVMRDGTTKGAADAAPGTPKTEPLRPSTRTDDGVDLPAPKAAPPKLAAPAAEPSKPAQPANLPLSMPPLAAAPVPPRRIAPAFSPSEPTAIPPATPVSDLTDLPGLWAPGAGNRVAPPPAAQRTPPERNVKLPLPGRASNDQTLEQLVDLPAAKQASGGPGFRVTRPGVGEPGGPPAISPTGTPHGLGAAEQPASPSITDLPALRSPAAQPLAPQVSAPVQPAPVARTATPSLTDLPGLKPAMGGPLQSSKDAGRHEGPTPKRSFARPSLDSIAALKPPVAELHGSLPKDSLAIEPQPAAFAGAPAKGGLGDLDDLSFDVAPSKPAAKAKLAPEVTPASVRHGRDAPNLGESGRTVLGIGSGLLPKDSLDLAPNASGKGLGLPIEPEAIDLPAPSDLPRLKGAPARQKRDSDDFDRALSFAFPEEDAEPTQIGPRPSGAMADLPTEPPNAPAENLFDFGDLDLDLPAPTDLPKVKAKAAAKAAPELDLDLPAPSDLPRTKAATKAAPELDLDLPAPSDLPRTKAATKAAPMPGAATPDFDLPAPSDLPVTKQGVAGGPSHAKPQTPAPVSDPLLDDLLDFAPRAPQAGASRAFSADELSLDLPPPKGPERARAADAALDELLLPRADSRRPGPSQTVDLDASDLLADPRAKPKAPSAPELELGPALGQAPHSSFGSPQSHGSKARTNGARGGDEDFGDLELGLDLDVKGGRTGTKPAGDAAPRTAEPQAAEAEIIQKPGKRAKSPTRTARRYPWWLVPVGLVATTGLVGTGLGAFTEHGYFGVYLLEQFLPEAGDPARVQEALEKSERLAATDTYADARKALLLLSDARNEAGLNHPLLVRSLLREATYQLRFDDDPSGAQRSAAILARIMERAPSAAGLGLARAADALRRGDANEATRLLATVSPSEAPERDLLAGELALRTGKPTDAATAFATAEKAGGGARATFGTARALLAQGLPDAALQKLLATLKESPLHADAHLLIAQEKLAKNELEAAASAAAIASGTKAVGNEHARPARRTRASAFATLGAVEEARDRLHEADAAYAQALAAEPALLPALVGSGRVLMRLGRPRDALSRFESALARNPAGTKDGTGRIPRVDAALGAAQALLGLDRGAEAVPRMDELAQAFPDHAEIALWLGHAYEDTGKLAEAQGAYERAIKLSPRTFSGYVALSQLLFARDRLEEGARVLSDATGKVDDSAEVRRLLGISELSRNHLPEALHQFQAALRFEPKHAGALLGLATTQRKTGALDAAEATLKRLASAEPTYSGLQLERGQLLESRGDYPAAVDAYRSALGDTPNDIDLKLRLAAALVTANRLDEAERILPEVLKERPTSAEAEHFTGRILFGRGDTGAAVQHLERAVQLDVLKAEYHLYLAWALLEQGSLAPALERVNQALERDPTLADAHWILGRIQLRTGAVKDALRSFERTLKLKPGRYEAYANMGDAHDELRELKPAIKAYETALRVAPDRADWWFRLGMLHVSEGGRDAARVALSEAVLRGDRALVRPKWLGDAHRAYADVLRESKRTQEAVDHYRRFLELAPAGHPDRREIERYIRHARH